MAEAPQMPRQADIVDVDPKQPPVAVVPEVEGASQPAVQQYPVADGQPPPDENLEVK